MEDRKLLKEYRRALLFFSVLALYLVSLTLRQSPLNSFEDDASWLLPSLAWDMSSLSWSEQLSRDVGERGALSLNMMLRVLYLFFDSWPVGYRLFGVFAHTICTFLMYVVLRACGSSRKISLWISICFFFCSLQFHAIFWIIGVQHVLAVASILATCIIANHVFRLCYCQYKRLKIWHLGFALTLLLMAGFNRASALMGLLAFSLFFAHYALKIGAIRKSQSSSLRLYLFYILGMLVIPAYSFYQLSRQNEGWQVVAAITNLGIPDSVTIYITNIYALYAGLAISLSLICLLAYFSSRYATNRAKEQFTTLLYFSGILGIAFSIFLFDKNLNVIPSILENLVSIPDTNSLENRWSPLTTFTIYSEGVTIIFNMVLCIILLTMFIYARPKKAQGKLFLTTCFFMIILGLAYFNSLTTSPLATINLPSRYAYYFTPAIIIAGFYASARYLHTQNSLPKATSVSQGFAQNWKRYYFPELGKIEFFSIFLILLIIANIMMMNKRLNHSSANSFATNYSSFILAESIAKWAKDSKHVGEISINLSGLKKGDVHPLIISHIPPTDSSFYPLIFNAQAYLTQMLGRGVRLRLVPGLADIKLCGTWLCDSASKPISIEKFECRNARFYFADSWYANEFQGDGVDRQIMMQRSLSVGKMVPDNFSSIVANEVLNRKNSCENSWMNISATAGALKLSSVKGLWQGSDFQYLVREIDPGDIVVRDSKGNVSNVEISRDRISIKKFGKYGTIISGNEIVWDDGSTWTRPDYLMEDLGLTYAQSYDIYPDKPNKNGAEKTNRIIHFLGQWKSYPGRSSILKGDYDEVMIVNENNEISKASIHGSTIDAIDWKVRGVMTPDGQEIIWNNGSVQVKPSASDLDGNWLYAGKRVEISLVTRQVVIMTNENGAKAKGIVNGLNLSVPEWNLAGVVSTDRRKITFSNGTAWIR
jgi:hypothetical protein